MEKSIETIWKDGFLQSNALVAPKLNNLYTQKSIDVVAKFKRMYAINRIAIIAFAIIIIPVSYVAKMLAMGIPMAILFVFVSFIAHKYGKQLNAINKNTNSYEYLSSFNSWIKDMVSVNSKLSTFMYPYVFLAVVFGLWFNTPKETTLGELFVTGLVHEFPNVYLVYGFPILLLIPLILALGVLAYFGGRIGKWDINLVYGRILRKIDGLLVEMEELRK